MKRQVIIQLYLNFGLENTNKFGHKSQLESLTSRLSFYELKEYLRSFDSGVLVLENGKIQKENKPQKGEFNKKILGKVTSIRKGSRQGYSNRNKPRMGKMSLGRGLQ
ncbi:hypothetical protein ACH5RR_021802 [Cinchona calisaya]|uniref:Uncharacterized protein n=1 Tax=Cinchona calisaya TaxID=153742 RepID=A0ABD2ZNB1_9GENT